MRSALAVAAATLTKFCSLDFLTGDASELRIDDGLLIVDEQVVHAMPGHHVLPQRHRSMLLDDDRGVTSDGLEPGTELFSVAHCR